MPRKSGSNQRFGLSQSLKIAVLAGGNSPERNISLRSGKAVAKALEGAGFKVTKLNPGRKNLRELFKTPIDVAFVALHGQGGEDGSIQKLLERKEIPYVGSDVEGCRRSFDKAITKQILDKNKIHTPRYWTVNRRNWKKKITEIQVPVFVKPLTDGSSYGIYEVDSLSKLKARIFRSVQKYGRLLIEKKIKGREFTVGVLGNRSLPVIELKPKRPFYDTKAKYTKGMCRYLVPAPISEKLTKKMQKMALKTHKILKMRDLSRVDFMVDEQGQPYVLEANAIPGFTELSLLPMAARQVGIDFEELCVRLLSLACHRATKPNARRK